VQEGPHTALPAPQPVPLTPPSVQQPAAEQTARTATPAPRTGQRVYSLEDQDVVPPVAIDQRIPPMPMEMTLMVKALHTTGVLDVLIDESGEVLDATIRRSVNAGFDNVVLRAARRWKYKPAVKDGVPVRYIKTIALVP
jgi:TonB family protein